MSRPTGENCRSWQLSRCRKGVAQPARVGLANAEVVPHSPGQLSAAIHEQSWGAIAFHASA